MFKKGSRSWLVFNILEVVLFLVLGILCIVFSGNADMQKWTLIIVGIFVIVDAAIRLGGSVLGIFVAPSAPVMANLVGGSSELALGITLIFVGNNVASATAIFQYIALFAGILLIVLSSVALIYSIVFLAKRLTSTTSSIANIIIEILALTLGIIILVEVAGKSAGEILSVFFILLGIVFIALALFASIVLVSYLVEKKKDQN